MQKWKKSAMGLCRMKGGFDILLKLKLGCHKNNKNVKKLSAMLKKYPKAEEGLRTDICFKRQKSNGGKKSPEGEIGSEVNKYTLKKDNIQDETVFAGQKEFQVK